MSITPTVNSDKIEAKLSNYNFNRVIEFIDRNIDEKITVDKLAEIVDISKYYFSRLFKNKTGISPYKFIIENRIELSKKLLHKSE
ncbi:MAG: helix-turn-helix domain-containing protein [Thermodesulfobacteriota bacterium]